MGEYVAYFRGEWVASSEVRIPINDRAFTVGDTVYDVTRTFNGDLFRLDDHVDRLFRSLAYVRIDPRLSKQEMFDLGVEAVARNRHNLEEARDFAVWHIVTRGPGREAPKAGPPTVIVRVVPIDFGYHAPYYATGVRTVIARTRNLAPDMLDPKVKHFSRMHFTLASLEAADVDPDAWAVLLDREGNVSEGVGYNIFTVSEDAIGSPLGDNVLEGVSRQVVFELADKIGVPVVRTNLQPYDLYAADEVFVTATSFGAVPVSHVDGRVPSHGAPGPVYRRLMQAWGELVGVDIIGQAEDWLRGREATNATSTSTR